MLESEAMNGQDSLSLLETIRQLIPSNENVFLVGGAVRDILLRRPVHDLDFALAGDALPLARRVADAIGGAFFILDDERNTARVIYFQENGGRTILDFATMRAADLTGDLKDRDFTVNAIAMTLAEPYRLIDPLGGVVDLREKRLKACSASAFQNDPVRILRGVRLALELKFNIQAETIQAMRRAVPLLVRTTVERQRDELFRMLDGPQVSSALRMLDQLGVLELILPELSPLKGVRQPPPHQFDVWEHTLATMQALERLMGVLVGAHQPDSAANLTLGMASVRLGRFREPLEQHFRQQLNVNRSLRSLLFMAALYHDIGKVKVRQEDPDGTIHFIGHEMISADVATDRARKLALSQAEVQRLDTIVRHHMRVHHLIAISGRPTRRAIYRFFRDTNAAGVEICLLALADRLAAYGVALTPQVWGRALDICRDLLESWWERPTEVINPPALLTGDDLMRRFGLAQGPLIGKLLQQVREAQAGGEVKTQDEAFRFVEARLEELSSQSAER